jgi:hypothetical protein
MGEIVEFPAKHKENRSNLEGLIDKAMKGIPEKDRERLKFELIKTIDSYDGFFTTWSITLPKEVEEKTKKQLYDIAHQEHARKMKMLADIIRLKIDNLVNEYKLGRF